MQFKVQSALLSQGFNMVTRALAVRPPSAVYEGVFVETMEGGVELSCTNGEMSIKTTVPAVVSEDGCALLPARLLYELIKKIDGEVDIKADVQSQSAVVKAMGSKTHMMCMSAQDFPDINDVEGDLIVTLPEKRLAAAVSRVIFALSSDETRRVLTGCLMEVYREETRFVCLDGFRLAMQKLYVSHAISGEAESESRILPGAIISEIARMVEDTDEPITLTCSKTHLCAAFGQTRVYCPLIAGEYINYKQILPLTWTTSCRVNRSALISGIERAALIAREGNNLLRLHIDDNEMTITANADRGNAVEHVAIEFDGAPLDIAFNAKYLLDVARNVDTNELAMRFNTNVSPCVICPVSGNQYTYLVLPVRTID